MAKKKKKSKKIRDNGAQFPGLSSIDTSQYLSEIVQYQSTFDKSSVPLDTSISFINLSLPNDSPFRIIKLKNLAVENISVTPSLPLFNGYNIPGRSSPIQAYSGGEARSVSFTMMLHRDLLYPVTYGEMTQGMQSLNVSTIFATPSNPVVSSSKNTQVVGVQVSRLLGSITPLVKGGRNNPQGSDGITVRTTYYQDIITNIIRNSEEDLSVKFRDLLNQFEAMNYPRYSKGGVVPPQIFCEIGDYIRIKGIPNITINYQRPIDSYGRYMVATVNVTITEILERSWDSSEVMDNRVRYNRYSEQI